MKTVVKLIKGAENNTNTNSDTIPKLKAKKSIRDIHRVDNDVAERMVNEGGYSYANKNVYRKYKKDKKRFEQKRETAVYRMERLNKPSKEDVQVTKE